MNEAKFQSQLKRATDMYTAVNKCTIKYRKEPDMGQWMPYDCHWVHKGIYIPAEVKINKLIRMNFNFNSLFRDRQHQIDELMRDRRTGCKNAWVIIYLYVESKNVKRAFAIDVIKIFGLRYDKVSLEWMEKHAIEFFRVPDKRGWKGRKWDISFLFNNI